MEKNVLADLLLPNSKPRMLDLVERAGFDVSDWANFKGGPAKAGSNPKYCYEWCYEQEGLFLLNIWYENMLLEEGEIEQRLNLRSRNSDQTGIRRVRAKRFDDMVQRAFQLGSHPRVIIQHRSKMGKGNVETRLLDPAHWTVVAYNELSGDFVIRRGVVKTSKKDFLDTELEQFKEGEMRWRFIAHRKREARFREEKIRSFKYKNGDSLFCEVPRCGFDFRSVYGELGAGFIHVHHLTPLASLGNEGDVHTLEDLAVVCPNCHAMIHRGGACRRLDEIIPEGEGYV